MSQTFKIQHRQKLTQFTGRRGCFDGLCKTESRINCIYLFFIIKQYHVVPHDGH